MNSKGNNMKQHLDYNTLSMYVNTVSQYDKASPETIGMDSKQYHEVLDHLACCSECREQVNAISTLHKGRGDILYQSCLTSEQQKMICDYIDGKLQEDESEKIRSLIENNADAMKSALHYQSHAESMASHFSAGKALEKEPLDSTNIRKTENSIIDRTASLVNTFFSIKLPLVYTMTATAALLAAIILIVNSPELERGQIMIASYQDNPVIQFTDKRKKPGIGFFTQSGSSSKPFEGIQVELVSKNTIKISWPHVDGAELYKMRIQVFNQGENSILKETATEDNHAVFNLIPAVQQVDNNDKTAAYHNKRYEWILYGNTTNDKMFYATGGFIIDKGY